MKTLLKDGLIFLDGSLVQGDIAIEGDTIVSVSPELLGEQNCCSVFNFKDCFILPGLLDVHVHLREPGFSYKETIKTGTLAGARGGYTALCAMPNLNPPPDCLENLRVEEEIIAKDAVIDVFPYGAITKGQTGRGELVDFASMKDRVIAFSDDGKGVQDRENMKNAMMKVAAVDGMIVAHCEDEALLKGGYIHDGAYAAAHGHKGICSESEWGQIARDIDLVRETGCRYHVCHVSTKESVELIRKAKEEGLPVTAETAPHYLVFCEDDLKEDGKFKMNPPLRSREDKAALIQGLKDGTIDIIATDHAPHSAEEKSRGLKDSAMGIVGLECAFSVLYTELVEKGVISLAELVEKMAVAPRRIFRLPQVSLKEGNGADLFVYDPKAKRKINSAEFFSKGKATPFDGREVSGDIILTMKKGRVIWQKTEK